MHVAQFFLFNSYIPKEFRKIIRDYYATNDFQASLNTSSSRDGGVDTQGSYDSNTSSTKFDLKFNYLVNDDIQIGIQNEYGRINNMVGLEFLGNLPVRQGVNVAGSKEKNLNSNLQNLNNLLNYSVWQKTNPITINLNIILYAKTDPLIDVVIPAYTIMSHCIIDVKKENIGNTKTNVDSIYGFPGLTAFEAINIAKTYDKIDFAKTNSNYSANNDSNTLNSKLMSLYINGIVDIKLALIKNITPVFSKHTAKSSYSATRFNGVEATSIYSNYEFKGDYPIYAELGLQIESLVPADSNMLWQGALSNLRKPLIPDPPSIQASTDASSSSSSTPENKPPSKSTPKNTPKK
jgi:hypothetical protein